METEKPRFSILLFPWLAHGHIFPYLELAKRILARKNFQTYLCTTPINFDSINHFLEKNSLKNSIHLVELRLHTFPDLPPHYHTAKNLPPRLKFTLHKAFQTSKASFVDIITNLKPHLVIYDVFQPWAPVLASSQGIPSVHFASFGGTTVASMHPNFPFPELLPQGREAENLLHLLKFMKANILNGDGGDFLNNFKVSCEIALLKTSKAFEEKYIDFISSAMKRRILAVGPLVTETNAIEEENSEIIQWLNEKEQHSTVYVSFGSEHFSSKEEIEEIARGLELSEVNFIWVVRFPAGEERSAQEVLPEGFLERSGGRGRVVTGWAPQVDILANRSTGGFVSHCGWSSTTESVYYGVPIVGMPVGVDMFINARMAVDAGVCAAVPRDENHAFKGETIGKVIREVIMEKRGEELRIKAREIGEKMKLEEEAALDEAAEELWRICGKKD